MTTGRVLHTVCNFSQLPCLIACLLCCLLMSLLFLLVLWLEICVEVEVNRITILPPSLLFFCPYPRRLFKISARLKLVSVPFNSLLLDIRELKNHDDGLVDDDRKWVTLYCASATSKFRRRGVVDDAKQSRITSSCNPQASAGINPLF